MADHAALRVAVAQIASRPGDIDANLRKHKDVIAAARAAGVELLLFPELSLTGHSAGPDTLCIAMDRKHPHVASIAEATGDMCSVFGFIEEGHGAQFFNTALAVRGGKLLHAHRKINIPSYGGLEEGKYYGQGRHVESFALRPPWRTGLLICADTWNPPLVHLAALQGTTLLLVPISSAAGVVGAEFDNPGGWETNLRFYALTYGMHVMMTNRVGKEGDLTFWGGSRIIDPFGRVLASAAGHEEELVCAELHYDDIRRARFLLPTLRDANLPMVQRELERVQQALNKPRP
ncbi:MAG: nitrilase-related carbon-nitrogen hydrolase [Burkholderiaceae bacterium]